MARIKTIFRDSLPNCCICGATELSVVYDMPYRGTTWANCCEKCRRLADDPNHPAGIRLVKGKHPKAGLHHGNDSRARQQIEKDHAEALNVAELEEMAYDSIVETADGCQVEPDGSCPHGYRSPLLVLGLI